MNSHAMLRISAVFCAALISSVAQAQVNKALIIKELDPWNLNSVEDECNVQGIPFDVIFSADVPNTDFYDYNMIFVMSCQADPVYNAVSNNVMLFDSFVRDGGFLAIHGCNRSCGLATGNVFPNPPGGIPNDMSDFANSGNVQNLQHPLMAGLGAVATGTSLSHTSFSNTGNMSDDVLITGVPSNNAIYFVRSWGAGHIAVGGLTSEFGYANNQDSGVILRNEVSWGNTHQIDCGDYDTDGDGIYDDCDVCPDDAGNDDDYDGVCFAVDLCEGWDDAEDGDFDGVPNGCDRCPGYDDTIDADSDTIPDQCDNCPTSPNPLQINQDNDPWGEVCDCDDTNYLMNRSEQEVCDGLDNNCDGEVDGANAVDVGRWYEDLDNDGEGNPSTEVIHCDPPDGFVDNNLDCDDTNRGVRTSAPDVCDGIDNDCDGVIDPNCETLDTDAATDPADDDDPGSNASSCSCSSGGSFPAGALILLSLLSIRRRE